jgi:hypothetical protein
MITVAPLAVVVVEGMFVAIPALNSDIFPFAVWSLHCWLEHAAYVGPMMEQLKNLEAAAYMVFCVQVAATYTCGCE